MQTITCKKVVRVLFLQGRCLNLKFKFVSIKMLNQFITTVWAKLFDFYWCYGVHISSTHILDVSFEKSFEQLRCLEHCLALSHLQMHFWAFGVDNFEHIVQGI